MESPVSFRWHFLQTKIVHLCSPTSALYYMSHYAPPFLKYIFTTVISSFPFVNMTIKGSSNPTTLRHLWKCSPSHHLSVITDNDHHFFSFCPHARRSVQHSLHHFSSHLLHGNSWYPPLPFPPGWHTVYATIHKRMDDSGDAQREELWAQHVGPVDASKPKILKKIFYSRCCST